MSSGGNPTMTSQFSGRPNAKCFFSLSLCVLHVQLLANVGHWNKDSGLDASAFGIKLETRSCLKILKCNP